MLPAVYVALITILTHSSLILVGLCAWDGRGWVTAGLSVRQVNVWFTNARKRIWRPFHAQGVVGGIDAVPRPPHDDSDVSRSGGGASGGVTVPGKAPSGEPLDSERWVDGCSVWDEPAPHYDGGAPLASAAAPFLNHGDTASSTAAPLSPRTALQTLSAHRERLIGLLRAVEAQEAELLRGGGSSGDAHTVTVQRDSFDPLRRHDGGARASGGD